MVEIFQRDKIYGEGVIARVDQYSLHLGRTKSEGVERRAFDRDGNQRQGIFLLAQAGGCGAIVGLLRTGKKQEVTRPVQFDYHRRGIFDFAGVEENPFVQAEERTEEEIRLTFRRGLASPPDLEVEGIGKRGHGEIMT